MFRPRFEILFKPSQDNATCLGSQLVTIIEFLKNELKEHVWYAADIDAFDNAPSEHGVNSSNLGMIGDDESLLAFCKRIPQILSGVFIAVDSEYPNQKTDDVELSTEDDSFRPIELDGVLVEIRTFDTSYFLIYSDDEQLMKRLSTHFGVKIATNTAHSEMATIQEKLDQCLKIVLDENSDLPVYLWTFDAESYHPSKRPNWNIQIHFIDSTKQGGVKHVSLGSGETLSNDLEIQLKAWFLDASQKYPGKLEPRIVFSLE